MAATTSILKKAGTEGIIATAKSIGSESGKRIVNGKPHIPGESCINKVKAIKEAVDMIAKEYDWEVVDHNIGKAFDYVKLLVPASLAINAGTVYLPYFTGSLVCGLGGGPGTFKTVYGLTKRSVVALGICGTCRLFKSTNSDKNSRGIGKDRNTQEELTESFEEKDTKK